MDNAEKILDTMKKEAKPLKGGEVAELTGIDSKEVTKVIKKLKEEGEIDSPKRCYYQAK